MNSPWLKSVFPIAAIFSFRMLGLFMLIPVFSLYALDLKEATPALIGIALGAYGLSQGLLQLPFGILSDHYGRKNLIVIGLLLFFFGSLLGAVADSIYGMICARMLQGAGAIGSVLIALMADLTPEAHRTKAMAVIGATIGLSFSLAMILSTAIAQYFGLAGIFYFTACLALFALAIVHHIHYRSSKNQAPASRLIHWSYLKTVFANKTLWRFNTGIFLQHWILTATFFVVPFLLKEEITNGNLGQAWHFYLALMLLAFLLMAPLIYYAEKKHYLRPLFLAAIFASFMAQGLLLFFHQQWWFFCAAMLLYFLAFNVLEASLPSFVSKHAHAEAKGGAMGVYSSCQFLGIFFGGVCAGLLYEASSFSGIFLVNGLLALLWVFLGLPKKNIALEDTESTRPNK